MTSFSVSVAVPLAVPLAGSGRMLGRERGCTGFWLGLELHSREPRAPPASVPRPSCMCAAVSSPPSGSQLGSLAGPCCGHEMPVLEQSPHCLQLRGSAASPTRPQRWPRGAESVPGAGGVTSAPAGAGAPGLGRTSPCLHLPARPPRRWVAGSKARAKRSQVWKSPLVLCRSSAGTGSLPHASPLLPGLAGCPCQGAANPTLATAVPGL